MARSKQRQSTYKWKGNSHYTVTGAIVADYNATNEAFTEAMFKQVHSTLNVNTRAVQTLLDVHQIICYLPPDSCSDTVRIRKIILKDMHATAEGRSTVFFTMQISKPYN